MAFTSRLGTNLSQPGNITLGGGQFNSTRVINLAASSLSFNARRFSFAKVGSLLYSGAVTVLTQARKTIKVQQRAQFVLQTRPTTLKVVQRTTTQLDSVPYQIDMAITEIYPYQVDVTQYLASGDSISNILPVLTSLSTGTIITTTWQGTISSAGNVVQVPIIGSALRLGQQYQLATTFTANSGKILTVLSLINIVA